MTSPKLKTQSYVGEFGRETTFSRRLEVEGGDDMTTGGALAVVTIGQTPRHDMTPALRELIGSIEIIEFGALDGMSVEGIMSMAPAAPEDTLLTKLRDGSSVTISARKVHPLMQAAVEIAEADSRCRATLLMCTGEFAGISHNRLLLEADGLLIGSVRALGRRSRVGVICPLGDQAQASVAKLGGHVGELSVAVANPYGELSEIQDAARLLAADGVEFIVLDCMGYDENHLEIARKAAGIPVLLARAAVGRTVAALLM